MEATLPKAQRLTGKKTVGEVMLCGERAGSGCLRCRWMPSGGDVNRILVSVPKRHFKRAVKRNLLKRRIRESYRRQKGLLPSGFDLAFVYTPREVLSYAEIYEDMTRLLTRLGPQMESEEPRA